MSISSQNYSSLTNGNIIEANVLVLVLQHVCVADGKQVGRAGVHVETRLCGVTDVVELQNAPNDAHNDDQTDDAMASQIKRLEDHLFLEARVKDLAREVRAGRKGFARALPVVAPCKVCDNVVLPTNGNGNSIELTEGGRVEVGRGAVKCKQLRVMVEANHEEAVAEDKGHRGHTHAVVKGVEDLKLHARLEGRIQTITFKYELVHIQRSNLRVPGELNEAVERVSACRPERVTDYLTPAGLTKESRARMRPDALLFEVVPEKDPVTEAAPHPCRHVLTGVSLV